MLQDGSSEPCNVPLEYLRNITNNFSDERLIGQGGFGRVYKGVLPNGEMVAVKKFYPSIPGVKDRQFENEAYHLMRLTHPNVVLFLGCCSETVNTYVEYNGKYVCAEMLERLLCLEYMPKGNLRGYLSDEFSGLNWDTRYEIIKGICYGVHYLHEEWQPNAPIVHMDLKPANILLDDNMVPKIADFGLSRLFSEEKTWTCTTSHYGTLGYMAPEYINRGLITTKSDIFSLGVMIIEIVTGHRDYPDENGISSHEFIELTINNWRNRMEKSPCYTSFEINCQEIRRCIQIGLLCVKFDRSKRPTTSQIIKMLHDLEGAARSDRNEWVRHLEDRSMNHIEEARKPTHLVTADDVGTLLSIEVQPIDDRKRKVFSREARHRPWIARYTALPLAARCLMAWAAMDGCAPAIDRHQRLLIDSGYMLMLSGNTIMMSSLALVEDAFSNADHVLLAFILLLLGAVLAMLSVVTRRFPRLAATGVTFARVLHSYLL